MFCIIATLTRNLAHAEHQLWMLKLTRRAFFLNLFMTENCLSLVLTMSPNGTFEAFGAYFVKGIVVQLSLRWALVARSASLYHEVKLRPR